jgi:exonuclease VII large subunit
MTPYETTPTLRSDYSTVSEIRNWFKDKVRRVEVALGGECVAPQQTDGRWNFDLVSLSAQGVDYLPCTIWEDRAPKIDAKLRDAGSSLEEAMTAGMALRVTGKMWLGKDGKVYVTVTAIEPGFVRRGGLYLEDQEAMAAMVAAGVSKHRLCPAFTHDSPLSAFQAIDLLPRRIIVLGPSGAQGMGDFKRRLRNSRSSSLYVVYRALSWTPAGNIRTMQTHLEEAYSQGMDLVLLLQGGGHWSMLRGYERADLALLIHKSRVPVATAVGHDANVSMADRAATLSFITPTAAAEAIGNALSQQYFREKRHAREAAAQKRRTAENAAKTAQRHATAAKMLSLQDQVKNLKGKLALTLETANVAKHRAFDLEAKVQWAAATHIADLLETAEQRVRFISRLITVATVATAAALITFGEDFLSLLQPAPRPLDYWLYAATVILAGAVLVVRQSLARRKIAFPSAKPMKRPHIDMNSWRFAAKRVLTIRSLRKLRYHRPA